MVIIENRQKKIRINQKIIKQVAERTLKAENNSGAEISIILVSDSCIRNLNRKYRGYPKATDVLAFPMQEGEFSGLNPRLLGDVVISAERAQIQARRLKHTLREELGLLTIHGLLHLLGYNDITFNGRKKMEEKEKAILKSII